MTSTVRARSPFADRDASGGKAVAPPSPRVASRLARSADSGDAGADHQRKGRPVSNGPKSERSTGNQPRGDNDDPSAPKDFGVRPAGAGRRGEEDLRGAGRDRLADEPVAAAQAVLRLRPR